MGLGPNVGRFPIAIFETQQWDLIENEGMDEEAMLRAGNHNQHFLG